MMTVYEKDIIRIKNNISFIEEKIERAAEKSLRNKNEIKLMAVSKTHTLELVEAAYRAGQRLFGENRVLEGKEKFADFHEDAEVHLIGHLQRNKAKHVFPAFSCVQSIDTIDTLKALEKCIFSLNRKLNIFIEVNTSHEESKHGCSQFDELRGLIEFCLDKPLFDVVGFMTIAPFTNDEKKIRSAFSSLRDMRDRANSLYKECNMKELSMGMSGDYELAVQEGSTLVRVGTGIFGQRGT